MSRALRLAGLTAGLVLIAFGVGAVLIGLAGRDEVNANIKREQIVGTPDMKPSLIAANAKAAGLHVALPTCDVAGKAIASGSDAKCFAAYMRIHALEATGGKTYAQMPQYASADGSGTSVGTFAIVMGAALLLTGNGFIVLSSGLLGRAGIRRRPAAGRSVTPAAAADPA